MKIGFNMFLWTDHVTEAHYPIFQQLKDIGYDGVQIPVLTGEEKEYATLKRTLDNIGLETTTLTILPVIRKYNPSGKCVKPFEMEC